MKILMVTAYPPVLAMHGGGVRMYHNIRILSSRHDVHVISFVINDEERERLRTVNSIAKSVTAVQRIPDFRPHWLSLKPFLVREFSTPEMRLAMEKIMRAERIDLVQCEYLQMAQFRVPHMPAVLTAHEALSQNAHGEWQRETVPAMKFQLFYRWMQMLRYETLEVARFNRVVTMTEQDARYLRSYVPKAHIQPIPIGVDTAEFSPAAEDCAQPLSVLFVGNFLHSPNVEAARFLVDEMAPRFPQIQFRIPGDNVPENLRAKDNVEFPGYIADTRTLYKRPNTIVVAPLFSGTGQRVKMLEAFAMGCPVVTTSLGAAGYPARGGVEAFIADTVDQFVAALSKLAVSIDLRRTMGERGRRMILDRFGWDQLAGEYLDIVEKAVVSR